MRRSTTRQPDSKSMRSTNPSKPPNRIRTRNGKKTELPQQQRLTPPQFQTGRRSAWIDSAQRQLGKKLPETTRSDCFNTPNGRPTRDEPVSTLNSLSKQEPQEPQEPQQVEQPRGP